VNDRPDAQELLGAVERFLREDVVPALEGPRRLHARVAANVVAMVGREIAHGDADLRAEWRGLAELLGRESEAPPADDAALQRRVKEASEELVGRIRAGEADAGPFRDAVLAHLKRSVDAKLAVSLGAAKEKR
jgi:hypothetical protein